jgi:hypothetical protein
MTTTKEVFYIGKVARLGNDEYANISWPIGKEIRVPEHIKEKGTIGRTAGHGVYIILDLGLVDFHTKETITVTETIETESV